MPMVQKKNREHCPIAGFDVASVFCHESLMENIYYPSAVYLIPKTKIKNRANRHKNKGKKKQQQKVIHRHSVKESNTEVNKG